MITINKANLRGHLAITIPILCILFGLPFIYSYLATKHYLFLYQKNILIISSFFLAWLYWSYFIVKWKLWAYKNVKELDGLKLLAIKQGLIWSDASFFTKTEIITKEERQELQNCENDFYGKSENDEDAIEAQIFFSKRKTVISFIVFLLMTIFGLFILVISGKSLLLVLFGIITSPLFGYMCFSSLKNLLNKKPQIIFSKNGIELNSKFYQKQEINELRITQEIQGRYNTVLNYLTFEYESEKVKILLNDLNTNVLQIEKLISKLQL
jgi:hypothetical protein